MALKFINQISLICAVAIMCSGCFLFSDPDELLAANEDTLTGTESDTGNDTVTENDSESGTDIDGDVDTDGETDSASGTGSCRPRRSDL